MIFLHPLLLLALWFLVCLSHAAKTRPLFGRPSSGRNLNEDEHINANDGCDNHDDDGSGWDTAPWLDMSSSSSSSASAVLEASRYEEYPQVFSPTGRLHFVEAAVKASKALTSGSNLVIALYCRDGLVVVSTVPTSPFLNTTSSVRVVVDDNDKSDNENDNGNIHVSTQSLFLFHDDRSADDNVSDDTASQRRRRPLSATSVPIFDLHPCLVAATAGNAVDGQILRTRLAKLGVEALEMQGRTEPNVRASTVAKNLANQLQSPTQQSGGSDPLLASTAVILGNRELWRIDPTGQFWKCHAVAVGAEADRVEEILYQRLWDGAQSFHNGTTIQQYMYILTPDEALKLACDCIFERLVALLPPVSSTTSSSNTTPKASDSLPRVFWHAVVLDYTNVSKSGKPKRQVHRGGFSLKKS